MLKTMSMSLFNATRESLSSHLEKQGLSEKIREELTAAAAHCNYAQDPDDIHAFVGM